MNVPSGSGTTPMYKPSIITLEGADDIYLIITEGNWNRGSYTYAKSEESLIYWEGNLT